MLDIIINQIIVFGFVFRDRYRSEGIYSDEQLYNCENYIYNNPVKAGICKHPEDYPYSNYKNNKTKSITSYSFIDVDDDKDNLCKKYIDDYLSDNNTDLKKLKKDEKLLKQLIISLKNEQNVSLRKISEKLKCSRDRVCRLYKE